MDQKSVKPKTKRFVVNLAARESEMLKVYAREAGITRPAALRRLVRMALRQYWNDRPKQDSIPANQLDLFDILQMDIFGNTTKQ